jgi:tRNA dimethylallyltransferase
MTPNTKKIIFIIGPTSIGKTRIGVEVAKTLKTDILSCDSRQFYKELQIGSAPPGKKELSEVKHHFIHHLSVKDEYNAGLFEMDAIKLIKELHNINDTIVIVGGSGLYVDAICKGFDALPEISGKTRERAISEYENKGLSWLQKKVEDIDPLEYSNYDPNNARRLLRILEIFYETGKKISSFKSNKLKIRPFEIIKIGLNTERKKLYEGINKRVDIMMKKGLLEEAISLLELQHKNALQTVGYKEIYTYLNDKCTLQEAVENIKKNTRRFAKRQLTWFRKDKSIKWFEPHQLSEIKTLISKL